MFSVPDLKADISSVQYQDKMVCIMSRNSRGSSSSKLSFMSKLVSKEIAGDKDVILINQENFLLKANTYKLLQAIPSHQFIFNPAVKITQHKGRPLNGMLIYVPEHLKKIVTDVSPGHWRVQAVMINNSNKKTLLFNVYCPVDKNVNIFNIDTVDINDDISETISVIEKVIDDNDCDAVIIAGDLNCNFSKNTKHTHKTKNMMFDNNLEIRVGKV